MHSTSTRLHLLFYLTAHTVVAVAERTLSAVQYLLEGVAETMAAAVALQFWAFINGSGAGHVCTVVVPAEVLSVAVLHNDKAVLARIVQLACRV